jgi:branched-chain amino acid transport system permease protein
MIGQQIVNGLMLGCIYMLVAVAFTLAIAVLNFLNFSIPGLFMLGAVGAWVGLQFGLSPVLAITCSIGASIICSLAVERLAYRPLRKSDPELPLVSSLGFLILFESVVLATIGSNEQTFPAIIENTTLHAAGLLISTPQLVSLVLSVALVFGMAYILKSTKFGRSVRALSEDYDTAEFLGIGVRQIVMGVFALIGVFTSLAGILFAINYRQVSPMMGEEIGFRAVSAMIIGGMGNVWGAVLGGLIVGLSEVLAIHFWGANFSNVAVFGLLLVILMIRPQGLLGGAFQVREKL